MGTDLHMFCERKVGNVWKKVSQTKGPGYRPPVKDGTFQPSNKWAWSPDRHYFLFGLLAGIRNPDVEPIAKPRGIPEDVSSGIFKLWKKEFDAHTPSYYLLSELLAVRDLKYNNIAYVNVSEYKDYLKKGIKAIRWKLNHPPRNCTEVSLEKMERISKLAAFLDEAEYYTKIEWQETYRENYPYFWNDILDAMSKLDSNPDNVRCVFWFDS